MSLTIGSLFAGIGGLELGLERAGLGPVVWQVEQSEYCRAVLAKHWPNATRYEDVRHVGRSNLAPVDVICGGFPCQDISSAGQRVGIRGERSGLWFEYARIIRELRPRYVIVENVAALLARGLGEVLGELAAIGYDAEWDCVSASAVGAPHQRDRLFLVAYPAIVLRDGGTNHGRGDCEGPSAVSQSRNRGSTSALAHPEREQGGERRWPNVQRRQAGTTEQTRVGSGEVADAERRGLQGRIFGRPESRAIVTAAFRRESGRTDERGAWHAEPAMGRLAHGIPRRLVELSLSALGNAVVPQVAEVVGRLILDHANASDDSEAA